MTWPSWGLELAFDTDDPEFARGVETGMLYERLRREPGEVRGLVRDRNVEMVLRLAEATGREVRAGPDLGGWLEVEFSACR